MPTAYVSCNLVSFLQFSLKEHWNILPFKYCFNVALETTSHFCTADTNVRKVSVSKSRPKMGAIIMGWVPFSLSAWYKIHQTCYVMNARRKGFPVHLVLQWQNGQIQEQHSFRFCICLIPSGYGFRMRGWPTRKSWANKNSLLTGYYKTIICLFQETELFFWICWKTGT
jgi:hypothetical protein